MKIKEHDKECSNVWGYNLIIVIWNAHSPVREHFCHITSWPFPTNRQKAVMDCLSVWGDAVILSSSSQSDSLSCIKMMISKVKMLLCLPNIYYVFSNILYSMRLDRNINKRAQRALERSPETKDFKFPFFIALSTTGDT